MNFVRFILLSAAEACFIWASSFAMYSSEDLAKHGQAVEPKSVRVQKFAEIESAFEALGCRARASNAVALISSKDYIELALELILTQHKYDIKVATAISAIMISAITYRNDDLQVNLNGPRNDKGQTFLHMAADAGFNESVKSMLFGWRDLLKVDIVNVQDTTGATPLHYAALCCDFECVRAFMAPTMGSPVVSINTQDKRGNTVLDYAYSRAAPGSGDSLTIIPFLGSNGFIRKGSGVVPRVNKNDSSLNIATASAAAVAILAATGCGIGWAVNKKKKTDKKRDYVQKSEGTQKQQKIELVGKGKVSS